MAARTPSADDILGGDLSAGDIEGGGGKHVIYSVKCGSEEHPLGVADEVTASSSLSTTTASGEMRRRQINRRKIK